MNPVGTVISGRVQGNQQAHHKKQARVNSSTVAFQLAICIGLYAGGVSHDMWNVALFLNSVEKVRHWSFGKDGHVFYTMGL